MRRYGRVALWVLGVPAALLIVLYLVLLLTPIPLPFLREPVREAVMASLSQSSQLELGDMALALEGGTVPVLRFSPVVYTDTKTGAKVRMEALEVGFSPVRAVIGQPGATVTIVAPHIQVNQDLFGPRLTSFDVVPDPKGGKATVRVREGLDAFPSINIGAHGIDVQGTLPDAASGGMRSDNDWLIYNLEAAAKGMADIVEQARMGRFSRLIIRDGSLDMNDALYGLFRQLTGINVDITPSPDGSVTKGTFSTTFAGTVMQGSVERTIDDDGNPRLRAGLTNFDFSSVAPFINDPDAVMAMQGAGALSMDVSFDKSTGHVSGGDFYIDMTGMDLRIEHDLFPIASSIVRISWSPEKAQFTMSEAGVAIGQSTGRISGVFRLGLDEAYGPTVGMSMQMHDVRIHPNDLPAPAEGFDMEFSGWSAPLYGAMGIDNFVATKPGVRLATIGRVDLLRNGMGMKMTVGGTGISADDLKRLWPYFISGESRDWFVKNITAGEIVSSTMTYNFPVGSIAMGDEDLPLPKDAVAIDIVAKDVTLTPAEGIAPIALEGHTRLSMRDDRLTVSAAGATYGTDAGDIHFANAAFVMAPDKPDHQTIEISGDVNGGIPAVVSLIKAQQPDALDPAKLPLDLSSLTGALGMNLVATITLDKAGAMTGMDYAINGNVSGFGSSASIEDHTFSDGQLNFSASQQGYRVAGQASVDGLPADLLIRGAGEAMPEILLSSTIDVSKLASLGFDVSDLLSGSVKFVARPMADGSLQMAVDIADAALTIKDLGITKKRGVPGELRAAIRQEGTLTHLSDVALKFGTVNLSGSLDFDSKDGLKSAEFSNFALSSGDDAQVALTPISGGYELKLRGNQLDLKPMLNRFFALGEGTGGPQATAVNQKIIVDAELKRAIGFYATTAFNVNLELTIKGTDMQRALLQAQFGDNRSISVTTNPTPDGRAMSVAFNDLGTVLRFINVYPNLEGGAGTLVMNSNVKERTDEGTLALQNFTIVNEDNLAQVIGNGRRAAQASQGGRNLEFTKGQVQFVRRSDRIEIVDGIVGGDAVGGTLHGFIYTDEKSYDLSGTAILGFGFSSALQKVPLLGPLLAGQEGDGLFGLTFAIRGGLENPVFKFNPMSLLTPGVFRRIFEYRTHELPRAAQ